jgi:restriction system protein
VKIRDSENDLKDRPRTPPAMAIPTFDKLLRPVLELAAQGSITRRSATDAMVGHFKLTPEEVAQTIPSGSSTVIGNRTGWAMTFLTKAGLISKAAPKTYRATALGNEFLPRHPEKIRVADLETLPGWEDAWEAGRERRRAQTAGSDPVAVSVPSSTATPQEAIAREIAALQTDLRSRLLQAVVEQSPAFFERLVLDVLIAMGYGGTRADAAEHLGRSGDEGIDGRINQDALGLDQILVQAKRFGPDNIVDRKTVQAFIGSLAGQGVTKGVFITTSRFADSAQEFVQRGSTTKIVLVDGKMLIDLMLRHGIGVRVVETHQIHELDQNYFDESES